MLRGDLVKLWGDLVKPWGDLGKLWGDLVKLWGGLVKLRGASGPSQGASWLAARGRSKKIVFLTILAARGAQRRAETPKTLKSGVPGPARRPTGRRPIAVTQLGQPQERSWQLRSCLRTLG